MKEVIGEGDDKEVRFWPYLEKKGMTILDFLKDITKEFPNTRLDELEITAGIVFISVKKKKKT